MNIVFITNTPFPYGGASTNRILSYTPGLVLKGHKVTILCLILADEKNARLLEKDASCYFQGVKIQYMAGNKLWPNKKYKIITKIFKSIISNTRVYYYLKSHRNEIDVVQVIPPNITLYKRYSRWCKRFGLKYVVERSELPDIVRNRDKYESTKQGRSYIKKNEQAFKLFDGWILETQNLADYYSRFFSEITKSVIVPMTVDIKRFNVEKSISPKYGSYIAYCGNMKEVDGISILIRAFAIVKPHYPNIKLVLAGTSNDVPEQKKLAIELNIQDDVLFIGSLTRDEVPQFLVDATVLALASPTSERSCATMPCKVGEYLCTGNPVVVTGLGEINKYLVDRVSAYLAAPDSAEAFALKLEEVLSNYDDAQVVGKRGRMVAINSFSTDTQVDRIELFYKELI